MPVSSVSHSRLLDLGPLDTFEQLREKQLYFKIADNHVGVDSGFASEDVYGTCLTYGQLIRRPNALSFFADWIPMRAFEREAGWTVTAVDNKGKIIQWEITEHPKLEEYYRHLGSEYRKAFYGSRTRQVTYAWVQRTRTWPNHLRSCEIEQIVLALFHQLLPFGQELIDEAEATPPKPTILEVPAQPDPARPDPVQAPHHD